MNFTIQGRRVQLEAALREPHGTPPHAAAVVCHPHPLYGGTLDNRVVYRVAKAATKAGLAALRFNFRGVGRSSGTFDHGEGERDDAVTAIDWLERRYPDLPLTLIGFSFGAWVGVDVGFRDQRIRAMIGLGLPINFYDFEFLVENPKPTLFIIGTNDEYCPRDRMERFARRLPPNTSLRWIEGADHFFQQQLDQVQDLAATFFRSLELGAAQK